ncbi:unannotated protein [freshwater metagenome]|uniref:Unannotated protein n=1 Tax=freshwater metagenome TaxID=449393 RepID=A0A6J6ZQD2_9ZZZZ
MNLSHTPPSYSMSDSIAVELYRWIGSRTAGLVATLTVILGFRALK